MLNYQNNIYTKIALKTFLVIVTIVAFYAATTFNTLAVVNGDTLYLAPSGATVAKGGQVNLQVRGNGTAYNAAQINLSFDPSQVEYLGYSLSGSSLSGMAMYSAVSGKVEITIYSSSNVSGDQLLSTFTFKSLLDTGYATIFLDTNSVLVNAGTTIANGESTFKITAPTVTAPPPPSSPSTPTTVAPPKISTQPTTITEPQKPTETAQTTAPKPTVIPPSGDTEKPSLITTSPVGYIGELISLKLTTNEPVKATVLFGANKDLLDSSSSIESSTNTFFLPFGELSKSFENKKTYYYKIELVDQAGNKTVSDIKELPIESIKVSVSVKDANGVVLSNSKVIINGKEYTTDKNGIVKLESVIPGSLTISLINGDKEVYLGDATIVAGVSNQSVEASPNGIVAGALDSKFTMNGSILYISLISAIALAIVVIVVKRVRKYSMDNYEYTPVVNNNQSYVNNVPTSSVGEQNLGSQGNVVITPTPSPNSQQPINPNDINNKDVSEIAKEIINKQ